MPRVLKTLLICSLLIAGAVSPAVAAGSHGPDAAATAHGTHFTGPPDGHTP